jgi:hypothetical protein
MMSTPKPGEVEELLAKTQKLPAMNPPAPAPEDSEEFLAQQEEVRQMTVSDI